MRKKLSKLRNLFYLSLILFCISSCAKKENHDYRSSIDLSGTWQFQLDPDNMGLKEKWYLNDLNDSIRLPGTTDISQKGKLNKDTSTMHLNRLYKYEGPAWYRKHINIPKDWNDQHVQLFIERTKPSKVWVDDQYVGESILLQSPQKYNLTDHLTPGKHTITVRVNNDQKLTPYGNVHIYTNETQTNWNGMIGDFSLEAMEKTHISGLQVYPDVDNKKIDIALSVNNQLDIDSVLVELRITSIEEGDQKELEPLKKYLTCDSLMNLEYVLEDHMNLWDEYQQPLYKLQAIISHKDIKDSKTVTFGMHKFVANKDQFSINGRTIFLRGKHDACVFPLTGHPPMNVKGWKELFEKAQEYGINHYRFHTWCPPEAAFIAADQTGMYLEPELPFWGGLDSDSLADMQKNEGIAMLDHYANHPSFVLFSPGNEIWSGHDRVEQYITELKEYDSRPLYTMGSNNHIGFAPPRECSDFFVGARTPYDYDTTLTHVRLTHAFVDSKEGGILNTQTPSTRVNYDYSVEQMDIPIISHEIGQYQIYPDYKEIEKYTGVVEARNLEVFRNRLKKAGMLDQNQDFQKASGAWSALCYKAEIEAALRTEGFGGFRLLDLQDFPGQGTALVGILDAFMDSKNVVSKEKWLQSCNDVVPLLLFDKYCWENTESYRATLKIANYSNKKITQNISWKVVNQTGETIENGIFQNVNIPFGGLHKLGEIRFPLSSQKNARKLTVNIDINNTSYSNTYPLWVYPEPSRKNAGDEIVIANEMSEKLISQLEKGSSVLFFPQEEMVKENSVSGLFPPDFWNYQMFKKISESADKPVSPGTLGILTDPEHPVFNHFPTDFHTNWQWFSIIKASNPLNLNATDENYRPVVQVIDNVQRNNKYGLIFEFKVGKGKLLVCMSDLQEIMDKPEAASLYNSIIHYMKSEDFDPEEEIDERLLNELL